MKSFPRRGEIWLVTFPDDPKSRPALIVSTNVRNELATSVLAVPVTSNPRPAPTHVSLPASPATRSARRSARRCCATSNAA